MLCGKISSLIILLSLVINPVNEKPKVYVLCYHGFGKNSNRFSFLYDELKAHLEFFKNRGYKFISFPNYLKGRYAGNKNILVTVDDGNGSVYTAYNKVFKPLNIKPLIAIYPAITGKRKYALTWAQLRELSDSGCYVAAHGFSHRYLNDRLYAKEKKAFLNEIYLSKKLLEKKLKIKVDTFVYPYGSRSDVVVNELKKAGYKYAFTIDNGDMKFLSYYKDGGAYNLPRYMITRGNRMYSFKKIIKSSAGKEIFVAIRKRKKSDIYNREKISYRMKPVKKVEKKKKFIAQTPGPVDRYMKYKNEKKMYDVNSGYKEIIVESDLKRFNYYLYDNLTYLNSRYSKEVKQVIDEGIIEAADNTRLLAINRNSFNNTGGSNMDELSVKNSGKSRLARFKEKYFKLTKHSYDIYSRWIDIIKEKIFLMGGKIKTLWNSVFA